MDFISYSGGPLPEDLLSTIEVPVMIGWGDQDPWEPIESGRAYADYDSVEVHGTRNAINNVCTLLYRRYTDSVVRPSPVLIGAPQVAPEILANFRACPLYIYIIM